MPTAIVQLWTEALLIRVEKPRSKIRRGKRLMIFAVYAISELTNFRNVTKCGSGSHHTIVSVSLRSRGENRAYGLH